MNKARPAAFVSEMTGLSPDIQSHPSKFMSWISKGWISFVNYFTRRQEPQVWPKLNAAGDVYYRAYDPYTGRSTNLTSDTDLRIWLDKLPY